MIILNDKFLSVEITTVVEKEVKCLLILVLEILTLPYPYFFIFFDYSLSLFKAFKIVNWVYLPNIRVSASVVV